MLMMPSWMPPISRSRELAVLLAVVMLTGLASCEDSQPAATQPTDAERAQARKQAAKQVQTLQQQFLNVINAGRDPTDLVEQGKQIVTAHPNFVPARKLLGQIMLRSRKFRAGYEQLDTALSLDEKARPKLQQLAGTLALQLGRFEPALTHYREAVSLSENKPKYRIGLAKALIETRQLDEARQQLLKTLEQDSSMHLAHGVLASLYRKQNKLGLARQHVRKAIELLPKKKSDQKAIYVARRASLLRRANRWDEAITVLRDLPTKQQYRPNVLREMALNWNLLDKPANAAIIYGKALNVKPRSEAIAAGAVRWALKAGLTQRARRHLEALRRINPRSEALQKLRAKIGSAEAGSGDQANSRAATQPKSG